MLIIILSLLYLLTKFYCNYLILYCFICILSAFRSYGYLQPILYYCLFIACYNFVFSLTVLHFTVIFFVKISCIGHISLVLLAYVYDLCE